MCCVEPVWRRPSQACQILHTCKSLVLLFVSPKKSRLRSPILVHSQENLRSRSMLTSHKLAWPESRRPSRTSREWVLFLCNTKEVLEVGPNPEFCVINQDLLVRTIWEAPDIREATVQRIDSGVLYFTTNDVWWRTWQHIQKSYWQVSLVERIVLEAGSHLLTVALDLVSVRISS
jgi:hypothetical protein